jgi:C1A family cysteine protease
VLENQAGNDDGATSRNAIKAAAKPGVCPEALWPYDPANVLHAPPKQAYDHIITRALAYYRIAQQLPALKSCIAEGYPFVFGVQMYDQTIAAAQTTGRVAMPAASDTLMGGHALLGVAYDDATETLTALNSLGVNFGDKGYLYLPYAYLADTKLSYDFWTIREIG